MAKNRETDSPKKSNQRVPKGKQQRIKQRRQPDSVEPKKVRLKKPEIRTARTEEEKALAKQYNYQRNRLKSIVKAAEKRGYIFEDFIPLRKLAPTKADVEKLKQIKGDIVYKHARYYDVISDKYIPGTSRRKQERIEAAKKAAETRARKKEHIDRDYTQPGEPPSDVDDILVHVYELIVNWKPKPVWTTEFARIKEKDKNTLKRVLDGAVDNLGRKTVARNCEERALEFFDLAWNIIYGKSGDDKDNDVIADLAAITAIVYGRRLTVLEAKDLQETIESYAYENPEE